jgi:putative MATE family efflux protein
METRETRRQFKKMTDTPIPRLVCSLAAPTVAGTLISAACSLGDVYFVSRLGTSAAGAFGVAFPLLTVMQAVGYTFGMGSGTIVSCALGKKDRETADAAVSTAFLLSLLLGGAVTAAGLLFLSGLLRFLGATPTILPFAEQYARLLLPGAPIICASFVLNSDLRAEGRTLWSMAATVSGGAVGLCLDPVLMFGLHMGISGAAAAYVAGQTVNLLILLFCYFRGKCIARIGVRHAFRKRCLPGILRTGMPSLLRQGLASAAAILLNLAAAVYGDAAVAAMSIVGRAFFFLLAAILGFSQGLQPVAGYNFGAGEAGRLKQAFRFSVLAGTGGLALLCAAGYWFAPGILALFRGDDPRVLTIGTAAFRYQCAVTPVQAFVVVSNMLFQSVGREKEASLIASLRQGLCFLPFILTLPYWIGLPGVELSQPCADLLSFLVSIPITLRFLRKLGQTGQNGLADAPGR